MKTTNIGWRNLDRVKVFEIRRDTMEKISPSFCSAKWLQTTLYLQTGYNHSCHHPSPHKIPVEEVLENPAALHNSKFKKEQRAKMLAGERPSECGYCWNIEDLGENHLSDRHTKTSDIWAWPRFYEIAKSNPTDDVYPAYLEVSFSNACNFACAYCSPDVSSTWMKDIKKNGPYPVQFGSHDLEDLKKREQYPYKHNEYNPYVEAFNKWFPEALPHLKVFRITGGEPTMSKDFWKTLDYIIENPIKDLEISINTNLGTPTELIDKLIIYAKKLDESCKECQIYTSCESHGEQIEYTRDGMDYDLWKSNVTRILDETDCRVVIMTTINILSLPRFVDFLKDMMEFRKKYDNSNFSHRTPLSFNYMRFPPHLQVTLLPHTIREKYANQILDYAMQWDKSIHNHGYNEGVDYNVMLYHEEINQIKRFCDYLKTDQSSGPKYRRNFVQFIREYDKRRNKNFCETFPEYEMLYLMWADDNSDFITVKEIE